LPLWKRVAFPQPVANFAQSLISQTLANFDGQLGISLFDRAGRRPVLTEKGKVLLVDARAVVSNVDLATSLCLIAAAAVRD
jgi:DNA-binding transcriptional LysR family regulator